jgi:hypothetical protein
MMLSRQPAMESGTGHDAASASDLVSDAIHHSSGGPLDGPARQFFEPRFGSRFDAVRLHTDARAADAAESVHARAFTLGDHIYFGRGEYQAASTAGRQLLAHELTHVIQQRTSDAPLQREARGRGGGRNKPDPPAKPAAAGSAKLVCGPNVTAQVKKAVAETRHMFHGWSTAKKAKACNMLVEPPQAAFAWDILDMHKNAWILRYRCKTPSASCPEQPKHPVCATQGANCGSTVQVGKDCYYAGSANYVIFGTMCKLCHDQFIGKRTFYGGMEFTELEMKALVYLYKVGGITGANVSTAADWAVAGYHGWPSGGTPPAGDRNNCHPGCPTPYRGSDKGFDFKIVWCPYSHPYAECTSELKAWESILGAIL